MTRTIIFHYHLFKNAGTSLDRILKENFGDRWVTKEFPMAGQNNTASVEEWIRDTPDAIAYSTHTAVGPLPQVEGVRIIPVMLLREPLDRIQSAYRFERKQVSDTWGANLAKAHDLLGYILLRLERKGDRQCRSFQTYRLASLVNSPEDGELHRAIQASALLREQGVLGLVEYFDTTVSLLAKAIKDSGLPFEWEVRHENISAKGERKEQNEELMMALRVANQNDTYLVATEMARFQAMEADPENDDNDQT